MIQQRQLLTSRLLPAALVYIGMTLIVVPYAFRSQLLYPELYITIGQIGMVSGVIAYFAGRIERLLRAHFEGVETMRREGITDLRILDLKRNPTALQARLANAFSIHIAFAYPPPTQLAVVLLDFLEDRRREVRVRVLISDDRSATLSDPVEKDRFQLGQEIAERARVSGDISLRVTKAPITTFAIIDDEILVSLTPPLRMHGRESISVTFHASSDFASTYLRYFDKIWSAAAEFSALP